MRAWTTRGDGFRVRLCRATGRFVRACVDIVRDDGFEKHRSFVGSNERCLLLVCRVIPNVQTRVTRRRPDDDVRVVVNLIISHTL